MMSGHIMEGTSDSTICTAKSPIVGFFERLVPILQGFPQISTWQVSVLIT